jgi:hypothetical protein
MKIKIIFLVVVMILSSGSGLASGSKKSKDLSIEIHKTLEIISSDLKLNHHQEYAYSVKARGIELISFKVDKQGFIVFFRDYKNPGTFYRLESIEGDLRAYDMYRRNELREYETKITLKKINAALRS